MTCPSDLNALSRDDRKKKVLDMTGIYLLFQVLDEELGDEVGRTVDVL